MRIGNGDVYPSCGIGSGEPVAIGSGRMPVMYVAMAKAGPGCGGTTWTAGSGTAGLPARDLRSFVYQLPSSLRKLSTPVFLTYERYIAASTAVSKMPGSGIATQGHVYT